MGDFFTGLSYGDQLEMGTAIVGGGVDYETLNAMIRQEQDARALYLDDGWTRLCPAALYTNLGQIDASLGTKLVNILWNGRADHRRIHCIGLECTP